MWCQKNEDLHLRIEEARRGLDNGSGAVEHRDGEESALRVGQDGLELKQNILRLHVEREGIGNLLSLAGRDLEVVLSARDVAQDALVRGGVGREDLSRVKDTSEEGEGDGSLLLVGKGDESLCRVTVDELDAEDICLGEGGGEVSVESDSVNGGGASVLVSDC